jgi:hypothetical protein
MAMNGWGAPEPAWWLNLQARREAIVELAGGIRRDVFGRAAVGGERERLWQRWRELDQNLNGYAAQRPHETAVVVLEPHGGRTGAPSTPKPEPGLGPLWPGEKEDSFATRHPLPHRAFLSIIRPLPHVTL